MSTATGEAKNKKQISIKFVLGVAAPIFAICVAIAASAVIDQVLFGMALSQTKFWQSKVTADSSFVPWPNEATRLLIGFVIVGIVGSIASAFVSVNRFSLHALYRNRLVRAFLGASNPNRRPNLFTDFDSNDNELMHLLWPPSAGSWRPFHIVNMALNTVATKRLAWQERKAEPFTASPLHCGSSYKGFRPSSEYGHRNRGISLGTAFAISGAAVSPNMGYQSTEAGSFALSVFNVRLGWWLGNPGEEGNRSCRKYAPVRHGTLDVFTLTQQRADSHLVREGTNRMGGD
jgi:hypothetical protein